MIWPLEYVLEYVFLDRGHALGFLEQFLIDRTDPFCQTIHFLLHQQEKNDAGSIHAFQALPEL